MKDEQKTKKHLIDESDELRGRKDANRDIAEQPADAIVTTDLSGGLTYFSPGFENMSSYSAEQILGTPAAKYYMGGLEERSALLEQLQREEHTNNH